MKARVFLILAFATVLIASAFIKISDEMDQSGNFKSSIDKLETKVSILASEQNRAGDEYRGEIEKLKLEILNLKNEIQSEESSETDSSIQEERFLYEIVDSKAVITGYTGKDTYIVIPSHIDGYEVGKIGESSFANTQITTIVISEGICEIDWFDAVILPFMSDDAIDSESDLSYFRSPDGKSLLLSPGNKDTRNEFWQGAFDDLTTAWQQRRSKEAYNLLYVATTRAKYANYILLNGDKLMDGKKELSRRRSESGIIRRAYGGSSEAYTDTVRLTAPVGIETWYDALKPETVITFTDSATQHLGKAIPRRKRVNPSTLAKDEDKQKKEEADDKHVSPRYINSKGADFGTAVHECFEEITWLQDALPEWVYSPVTEAQQVVAAALQQEDVKELFTGKAGLEVYNEQSIEAITDADEWVSGTIDRLVLTEDDAGTPTAAHIIDFKTNRFDEKEGFEHFYDWLRAHYTPQMQQYRSLIAKAFGLPAEAVTVSLISCPKDYRKHPACVLTYRTEELSGKE